MTRHLLRFLPAVALLVIFGCAQLMRKQLAEEGQQRWDHVRARVKLQLAEKSFNNRAIDDAWTQCEEVVRLDPSYAEGHLLATRIQLEKGDISKAQASLNMAQTMAPGAAEGLYLEGVIAERQGRMEDALKRYQEAHQANPEELDYLLTYVELLIATDQYESALRTLTPRRKDFEHTPAVHAMTGQALSLLGRCKEAAECYSLAIQLAPQNPLLREEAGVAFASAGWYEQAIETLIPLVQATTTQSAKGKKPAGPSLMVIRSFATALLKTGKIDQAVKVLDEAIKKHPEVPELWLLLAEGHVKRGSPDLAKQATQKVLEFSPDQPDAHLLQTYLAFEMGSAQQAVRAAQEMVDRCPQDIEARAMLALALEKLPDGKTKAAEQYRCILSIAPAHRWAQAQLQRLDRQVRAN